MSEDDYLAELSNCLYGLALSTTEQGCSDLLGVLIVHKFGEAFFRLHVRGIPKW